MFLKNWYHALAGGMVYGSSPNLINVNGSAVTTSYVYNDIMAFIKLGYSNDSSYNPTMHKIRTTYTGSGGVVLGTGTTPPSMNDYRLSGELITTVTSTAVITKEFDESGATITALYTITNTGTDSITIGELGLKGNCSNSYSSESYMVMWERTVLDSPVTIQPGGVGQVTYTIRIEVPTA